MNVVIFAWHRVAPLDGSPGDEFTVDPGVFRHQLELLRTYGYVGVDLDSVVRGDVRPDRRIAVLTFDDGFAANREHAWPALDAAGFRATTFVVTDRLGGCNDWDFADVPRYPLLSAKDCAKTSAPMMTFHSHSATHRRLSEVDTLSLSRELTTSRKTIRDVTGTDAELFAYPFGSVTSSVAHAVRQAGYRAACTCMEGLNHEQVNPLLMRRVAVKNGDVERAFARLLRTGRRSPLAAVLKARARAGLIGFSLRTGLLARHRA